MNGCCVVCRDWNSRDWMLSTLRGRQALSTMGQTLRLDANAIALSFADETMENLHTRFYRSKLTYDPPSQPKSPPTHARRG